MFSRNLYEIEEVSILLFQSILGKRKTEANFWGHELYISQETKLLKEVLKLCALLFAPTYPIYNYTITSKTPEDYEHMINILCYCSNKQSFNEYNLLYGTSHLVESKDSFKTTKASFDKTIYTESKINTLVKSCIEKKQISRISSILYTFQSTMGMTTGSTDLSLFDIQEDFKKLYKELPENQKHFGIHAISRWLVQTDFIEYKEPSTNNWSRWTKLQGTKEARLIAINPIVLKNWIDRMDVSSKLVGDPTNIFTNGSKYFKQFDLTNPDNLEKAFFEIFKDDIPDEWSNEERLKSHSTTTKNSMFTEYAYILNSIIESE